MQYFIKTKLVKFFTDTLYVKDEANADKFLIKERFSIPAKWDFFDITGTQLMRIKKRMFRFFGRYDVVNTDKKLLAVIKRKFNPFVPKYKITNMLEEKADYQISGDIIGWSFKITKDGQPICEIRKQIIALTNNYHVNVLDENETLLCFACVIALSKEHHKNDNKKKNNFRI